MATGLIWGVCQAPFLDGEKESGGEETSFVASRPEKRLKLSRKPLVPVWCRPRWRTKTVAPAHIENVVICSRRHPYTPRLTLVCHSNLPSLGSTPPLISALAFFVVIPSSVNPFRYSPALVKYQLSEQLSCYGTPIYSLTGTRNRSSKSSIAHPDVCSSQ